MKINREISPIIDKEYLPKGYILAPYMIKTVSTSINGETVWYSNKWKILLLKIKFFFYKSKNLKNSKKYLNKKVNHSFYKWN